MKPTTFPLSAQIEGQEKKVLEIAIVTERRGLDDYFLAKLDHLNGEINQEECLDSYWDIIKIRALWECSRDDLVNVGWVSKNAWSNLFNSISPDQWEPCGEYCHGKEPVPEAQADDVSRGTELAACLKIELSLITSISSSSQKPFA
jgi:hypothetical protein